MITMYFIKLKLNFQKAYECNFYIFQGGGRELKDILVGA